MSQAPPYAYFDHTADVGIEAHGETLEQLFANAALAAFGLMADLAAVEPHLTRRVVLEGSDLEDLLVAWLNELLYISSAEQLLFGRFEVQQVSPTHLEATLRGEPIDPARHHLQMEIKAATYHQVTVEHDDDWCARVVLDV